jgi:hypothetical protein
MQQDCDSGQTPQIKFFLSNLFKEIMAWVSFSYNMRMMFGIGVNCLAGNVPGNIWVFTVHSPPNMERLIAANQKNHSCTTVLQLSSCLYLKENFRFCDRKDKDLKSRK